MTQYYVKSDGNNGDTGLDWAHAWATISHAMLAMAEYDTLNIMEGAYPEDVDVTTAHLTLIGAGSGLVTISSINVRASYTSCSGVTLTAADSMDNGVGDANLTIDDVICLGLTVLPDATGANITNCDFTGIVFPYLADGLTSTNNVFRAVDYGYTLYIGCSGVTNATFENTTILGNIAPNNAIKILGTTNNITFTNTTFEYPELAIEIAAGLSATFIQDNNKVFIGTTGTNTVDGAKSTLVATEGTYDYRNFVITPDAEITITETSLWETTGDQNKTWGVEATGSRTITFVLGDMLPDTMYNLKVGGVKVSDATADASGVITFPAYTGSFSEKIFTTELTPPVTFISQVIMI